MTGQPAELNELELDALAELANIGVGRAAASLRQMVGSEVLLSVPSVEMMTRARAAALLEERALGGSLVGVHQEFTGSFSGCALLMFPEANSHELVRAVAGGDRTLEDVIDLEQEAIQETGNIVLNGYLATIANILKRTLAISVPQVRRGSSRVLLWTAAHCAETDLLLFLYINFTVKGRSISGYIALTMDVLSLDALRALVRDFIDQATGTED